MFKAAATKVALFAFDTTTGAAKTGDAANITAYLSKDYGSVTQLGDTSATEMDATNAKGWYLFDVTGTEATADACLFTGKSSTANISVVGQMIFTTPASFTAFVTPTNLTAAQIATGVWQDTTAGDFTTALSVGKSVMNGVSLGTGLTVASVSGAVGSVTGAVGSVTGAVGSVTGAVGSVTGNVGGNVVGSVASVTAGVTVTTNNDKTGYALTAAYDLAKTASQAGDAMALTAGERNSTADALLARNVSGGSSAGRTVKQALHFLRNKFVIAGGTMTVYDTDDTTSSWTSAITTTAGDPVSTSDPA
jgi:hypothetical protein